MRKYIVTGGAGFIGSNLTKKLIARGNEVFVIDNLSTGFERNVPHGAIFCKADISNTNEISSLKLPDKIDTLYHLAAQSSGEASFEDPLYDIDINYKATCNLLKLAEAKKCGRFIYPSSMSVYGEAYTSDYKMAEEHRCSPISYYGCNKLASEKLIQVFTKNTDIKSTIFRLFTVYGPGQNMLNRKQGMVSIYLSYLLENKPVLVKGSLGRFRDFIYIDDVLEAFISCENDERSYGEIFNLGTGIKTTVQDLLTLMLKLYDKKDFYKWVNVEGNTLGDITGCIADISKLKKLTRWSPKYDLEYGIKKMKAWLEETAEIWLMARKKMDSKNLEKVKK
jgi:UDP-glucose 4-epimerase